MFHIFVSRPPIYATMPVPFLADEVTLKTKHLMVTVNIQNALKTDKQTGELKSRTPTTTTIYEGIQ